MTQSPDMAKKSGIVRLLPILLIAAVAVVGAFTLKDYLSFQTLADNREALIAWRDNNYILASLVFIAVYATMVTFSLPGATIASFLRRSLVRFSTSLLLRSEQRQSF